MSTDGCFQQNNDHATKLKSFQTFFLNVTKSLLYSIWSTQSPDLNEIEHTSDAVEQDIQTIDVQLTYLQQLCYANMSIRSNTSEQSFQHIVEYLPGKFEAVLRVEGA